MPGLSDAVRVIEPGKTYVGKQGFTYGAGASMETVGAERICMNVLPVPVGGRAKVHYHQGIETIAYLLEGECAIAIDTDAARAAMIVERIRSGCPEFTVATSCWSAGCSPTTSGPRKAPDDQDRVQGESPPDARKPGP